MDYMKIANHPIMWAAAAPAVILAVVQAVLFARKSFSSGKRMGISEKRMKAAMKSSFITSIGPSLVILTGLLSLLVTVGGPMAWMRLSYIGSVMFELMAAGFGAEAMGVQMGIDTMTEMAFANAVWVMILGSLGWILVSVLTADKMGKVQEKFAKRDAGVVTVISTTAVLGAFGALVSPHLLRADNNTIAAIAGALIMLGLSVYNKKKNAQWIKEWSLAIALFGGMIIAAVL